MSMSMDSLDEEDNPHEATAAAELGGMVVDSESDEFASETGEIDIPYTDTPIPQDVHRAKLNRVNKYYNDKYLQLFLQNQNLDEGHEPLDSSQIGSVKWTDHEKQKFFNMLSRKGRHNVPAIAEAIGTKSEIEVTLLLLKMKDAEVDRQKFAIHSRNISHAEINAAIEVDKALEVLLENSADALAAYQDHYDNSEAKNRSGGLWLIDSAIAAYIENKCEQREEEGASEDNVGVEQFTTNDEQNNALALFHVDTMLELSREVFMNTPQESHLEHWTSLMEEDEDEPCMTVEVVTALSQLVKSIVQRVLQSALFLAESRLRATSSAGYVPARILKDTDIVAALNVLNMPVDSFEHWVKLPRKNGLRVVLSSHAKQSSTAKSMSMEDVESILSVRASRGRRRSLSSMVSTSSQDGNETDVMHTATDVEQVARSPTLNGGDDAEEDGVGNLANDDDSYSSSSSSEVSQSDELEDSSGDTSAGSNSDTISRSSVLREQSTHLSRKRRKLMSEKAQDEFLEKLDHLAQTKEGVLLRQSLGFPPAPEQPEEELERRPKTTRKTPEELEDWASVPYRAPWERKRPAEDESTSSASE